jgi:hypothetical protein
MILIHQVQPTAVSQIRGSLKPVIHNISNSSSAERFEGEPRLTEFDEFETCAYAAELIVCAISDLLSAPARIRIPHVGWWFDRRRKLEGTIAHADSCNDGAGNDPQNMSFKYDTANKDVDCKPSVTFPPQARRSLTDAAAEEREQKARVFREVWWNLWQ